jgi:hypothetical protein
VCSRSKVPCGLFPAACCRSSCLRAIKVNKSVRYVCSCGADTIERASLPQSHRQRDHPTSGCDTSRRTPLMPGAALVDRSLNRSLR